MNQTDAGGNILGMVIHKRIHGVLKFAYDRYARTLQKSMRRVKVLFGILSRKFDHDVLFRTVCKRNRVVPFCLWSTGIGLSAAVSINA